MGEKGGCHCGIIRYEITDGAKPVHHALCHCTDCRRVSGAPAVSWSLFSKDQVAITGKPAVYNSSPNTSRFFCGNCGTSLFFENPDIFPDQIDIQSATLDNPDAFSLGAQIQIAERIGWMETIENLPTFNRYPGMD